MARCMGFSEPTVKSWCADPTFPGGSEGPWQLSVVLDWWRHKRSPVRGEGEEDPFLSGESSPALERYRAARAEREEIGLAVLKGELIPREKNRQFLGRLAGILRQAGDVLQQQFGVEPHRVLDDALMDVEREVIEVFGREPVEDRGDSSE